jgi:methylase of polypeptide subunit release factors
MFPENPWWIREHSIGAESNAHYADAKGRDKNGFMDSLVGKTAIEYEKNLMSKSIFATGLLQVKEYCSALLNQGDSSEDIIGVLSDTVHWHAYWISICNDPKGQQRFGPGNLILEEIESINLEDTSDYNILQFAHFINRNLGREGSKRIKAFSISTDIGINSRFYANHIDGFHLTVKEAFSKRIRYGNMIAGLWNDFVNRLDSDEYQQKFNQNFYTNELYIITLVKLLCANILHGAVVKDENFAIKSILTGEWFKERGFVNFVEYDYFGWLNEYPYIDDLVKYAIDMQNDLAAYDYKNIATEDLFGPLVAQLADKEHRLLLGQEFTPQWVSSRIVAHTLEMLPKEEYPCFIDMCCGSGVFVVETLKQTIAKYNITTENFTQEDLNILLDCIVGFDIDPMAVLLAKANWVMSMRQFIPYAKSNINIPIYNSDSLFTAESIAEVSHKDKGYLYLNFDGEEIKLPDFLLLPQNSRLFDSFINSSYSVARRKALEIAARNSRTKSKLPKIWLSQNSDTILNIRQIKELNDSYSDLVNTLTKLQIEGRNGIWPFFLSNSCRPELIDKQFNAIVSNPPWMAMSKLSNNPYKSIIDSKAKSLGLKPTGSSHLHIELAVVFLITSVDKFLKPNAIFGVILPETLLNGDHHEPFRNQKFLSSEKKVQNKQQ